MNNQPRSRAQIARDVVKSAPRRRYEYTTLSAERPLTAAQLSDYGADGWELVSMYVLMPAVYAVFKREAP